MIKTDSERQDNVSEDQDEAKMNAQARKLQQILDKAKQIAPWLGRQDLLRVYKQCYENQSVFLNKINSISNSREQKDEGGWITNKKKVEAKPKAKEKKQPEEQEVDVESKFKNYSFLKDQKLLKRIEKQAQQIEQSKKETKKDKNYRTKQYREDTRNYKNTTEQRQQKKAKSRRRQIHNKNQNQSRQLRNSNRPQIRYVPKEEHSQDEIKKQQSGNNKNKRKFIEKAQSQAASKEVSQTVEHPIKPIQEKICEKPNTKEVKHQNNTPKQQPKTQIKQLHEQKHSPQPTVQTKKQQKSDKKAQQPKQQRKQQKPLPSPTKPTQKLIESPSKTEIQMGLDIDSSTRQAFQLACKQNPYILPFIMPTNKTQKIQYVLDNKKLSNVKVRVVTDVK